MTTTLSQACATLQPGLFSSLPSGKTATTASIRIRKEPAPATNNVHAIALCPQRSGPMKVAKAPVPKILSVPSVPAPPKKYQRHQDRPPGPMRDAGGYRGAQPLTHIFDGIEEHAEPQPGDFFEIGPRIVDASQKGNRLRRSSGSPNGGEEVGTYSDYRNGAALAGVAFEEGRQAE